MAATKLQATIAGSHAEETSVLEIQGRPLSARHYLGPLQATNNADAHILDTTIKLTARPGVVGGERLHRDCLIPNWNCDAWDRPELQSTLRHRAIPVCLRATSELCPSQRRMSRSPTRVAWRICTHTLTPAAEAQFFPKCGLYKFFDGLDTECGVLAAISLLL